MKMENRDKIYIGIILALFALGVLRDINLPGLYMDAVNPDYLAAQTLNPALHNPNWILPTVLFPILGNLYHGVQNYYVDLFVFQVLGISIASIRIAQALFGAAIIVLVYLIGVSLTDNRKISFMMTALLAVEIAFIASFRTQFYIVLGGEAWLFASLLFMRFESKRKEFLSGLFYGLSIYGYFVMAFFGPAMLLMVLVRYKRKPYWWGFGCFIGLIPYLIGYLSLMLKLGGLNHFIGWMEGAFHGLVPFASKLSLVQRIQYALKMSSLAISNGGNRIMIFGGYVPSIWPDIKIGVFVLALLFVLSRIRRGGKYLFALLPISYISCSLVFGSRLWAHHYSVLVPLAYLILIIALADLISKRNGLVGAILFTGAFAFFNIAQCNSFFNELNRTGGIGKYSNALNRFAENSMSRKHTLYVFPQWGFFMPFDLLTENSVPYSVSMNVLGSNIPGVEHIVIASWTINRADNYKNELKNIGYKNISVRPYMNRLGSPQFYLVRANMARFKLIAVSNSSSGSTLNISFENNLCGIGVAPYKARVHWSAASTKTPDSVYVGSKRGPYKLFARGGALGTAETGRWVEPGQQFVLKSSNGSKLAVAYIQSKLCH